MPVTHIAIFASGTGTNAQQIINHFRNHSSIRVALIVTNKPDAGVLQIAKQENLPSLLLNKERFFYGDAYTEILFGYNINFVVLAGFLWKIPEPLIAAYRNRIINIHPALLPKFGGKGMFGRHVHQAVIEAKEKKSGITIHYVDELYDHGQVIFQASVDVTPGETAETLAEKIHTLEHFHFPVVIEQLLEGERIVKTE